MSDLPSRRDFLDTAGRCLSAGWLLLQLPAITAVAACAREAARSAAPFRVLTAEEAATMQAFARRIFPSDDLPGADEAGAVYFVDAALAGMFPRTTEVVRPGLADLDSRARARGAAAFAALEDSQQDELIREVEATPFFFPARMLVLMGVLTDPVHGGNRNGAAAELVGIQHAASWQPPFGYYDAQMLGDEGGAEVG